VKAIGIDAPQGEFEAFQEKSWGGSVEGDREFMCILGKGFVSFIDYD
jgi:hypothetical protein